MTQPTRSEVRSRNKRHEELTADRYNAILGEVMGKAIEDYSNDDIVAELESRGFKVTLRSVLPKYVVELRAILKRYYGHGQGFSPAAAASVLFSTGTTTRKGTVPNISEALTYLVTLGEVEKYSATNYALAPGHRLGD